MVEPTAFYIDEQKHCAECVAGSLVNIENVSNTANSAASNAQGTADAITYYMENFAKSKINEMIDILGSLITAYNLGTAKPIKPITNL